MMNDVSVALGPDKTRTIKIHREEHFEGMRRAGRLAARARRLAGLEVARREGVEARKHVEVQPEHPEHGRAADREGVGYQTGE